MDLEISSQMHPNAEFQMHPNAEFQMHPNAEFQMHPNADSKCIQMNNRSVENEKRSVDMLNPCWNVSFSEPNLHQIKNHDDWLWFQVMHAMML